MFELIEQSYELCVLLRQSCEENDVGVIICDELLENGELRHEHIKILKVDEYYSSQNFHNPPPAIDCLIIVKEDAGSVSLFLIELRNSRRSSSIKPSAIRPKFETTLRDFMETRFQSVFLSVETVVASIKLWLITVPIEVMNKGEDYYRKKIKLSVIDQYASQKPFRFRGKVCLLEVYLPRPEVCKRESTAAARTQ
jgi:hypothetical protein